MQLQGHMVALYLIIFLLRSGVFKVGVLNSKQYGYLLKEKVYMHIEHVLVFLGPFCYSGNKIDYFTVSNLPLLLVAAFTSGIHFKLKLQQPATKS